MRKPFPIHYSAAIEFALTVSSDSSREFTSDRLHLYVQRCSPDRGDLQGKLYLECFEKVPGGVTFLNWWAPATPTGVRQFFTGLAKATAVSPRPYRLRQCCDGTIGSSVLHAYKVACDALALDANALYLQAYGDRGETPPNWSLTKGYAEWQGGIAWPDAWNEVAIGDLAESLTEINYHSLRSTFTDAAEAVLAKGNDTETPEAP